MSLMFLLWGRRAAKALLRRMAAGRCPSCGYDLTGNVSGRCPECGTEVPAARATGL